jgi:hypothetical protein
VSPTIASISSTAMVCVRALGRKLGDQPTAHGVPGEHAGFDAQLVDDAAEQSL